MRMQRRDRTEYKLAASFRGSCGFNCASRKLNLFAHKVHISTKNPFRGCRCRCHLVN